MRLELVRHAYLPDYTLGWLKTPEFALATIERPWIPHPAGPGGQRGVSCVPDGAYALRPHDSAKFPETYALLNPNCGVWYHSCPAGQEWGRTAILIHVGNRVRDLLGCIAVGMGHGQVYGSQGVLQSKVAMDQLRELLGRGHHELVIRPTRGTIE